MLRSLDIKNLALIDDSRLRFGTGLIVLSGETGAGKSVIVTALSLALGGRAEREFIRHGTDTAEVSAVFEDPSSSTRTAVNRELTERGTNKLSINGTPATVTQLRELVSPMVQILGQHAGQLLMSEDNHLQFLDSFAGLTKERITVSELFALWRQSADELSRIRKRRDQLVRERELLLFQQDEIEHAHIRIGEEEELQNERRILDSARELMESASRLIDAIGGEDSSLLDLLGAVRRDIDRMAAVDTNIEKQAEELAEIDYRLEEIRRFLEQYGSSLEDNPTRLEEINLRLDELYNLKKKYGGSEEAILATLAQIREHLNDRPDTDDVIDTLEKEVDRRRKAYTAAALKLSDSRRGAAEQLRTAVIRELKDLAIDEPDFLCELVYEDSESGVVLEDRAVRPFEFGLEKARFLFSANPGEPLKSMVKTASGGELSRVLLALKSAELEHHGLRHSMLVFDEVDVGIGGRTALQVARKLKKLSESSQVLVITHLHQIARLADQHMVAEKRIEDGNRTVITVRDLDAAGVQEELDRMVALPETDSTSR